MKGFGINKNKNLDIIHQGKNPESNRPDNKVPLSETKDYYHLSV